MHNLVTGLGWVYYKTILTEVLEKFSQLLKDFMNGVHMRLERSQLTGNTLFWS